MRPVHVDFTLLDIVAEVERHTSTRLRPASASGKQWVGACPFEDCLVDDDGFIVWPELTERQRHYFCRGCRRSGTILTLISEIKGITQTEAAALLLQGTRTASPMRKRVANGGNRAAREHAQLHAIASLAQRALQHPRAQAYLQQRALPLVVAQTLGLGYIPPFEAIPPEEVTPALRQLRRWCDRILFPLHNSTQQGWTGRCLQLWEPGMDETEHKRVLEAHDQQMLKQYGEREGQWQRIPRWKTTTPGGAFLWMQAHTYEHLVLVEGPWDACALVTAGIPAVMATCGLSIDLHVIPKQVHHVILAFDGDDAGQQAARRWSTSLYRKGMVTITCQPPEDGYGKDWSARFGRAGLKGVAPLLALWKALMQETATGQRTHQEPPAMSAAERVAFQGYGEGNAFWWGEIEQPLTSCVVCGLDLERAPPAVDFGYTPQGILLCEQHW